MKTIDDYIFVCDMAIPCGFLFLQCWECGNDELCWMHAISVNMIREGRY